MGFGSKRQRIYACYLIARSGIRFLCRQIKNVNARWRWFQHRKSFLSGKVQWPGPRHAGGDKRRPLPLTLQAFKQENPGGLSSDTDLTGRRAARGSPADEWYLKKLQGTFNERETLGLVRRSADDISGYSSTQESLIIHEDNVCIHVVGLPASLTNEVAFSGVYGIINQRRVWRSPDSNLEIFEADTKFYHRDQFVPIPGSLTGPGVNYHGELHLTADRTEIVQRHVNFRKYKEQMKTALDIATGADHVMATRIISSFLITEDDRFMPRPASTARAYEYKLAFERATRTKQPDLFQHNQAVFSYSRSRKTEDEDIIRELGFVPLALVDWQKHVLEASGAYVSPTKHSEKVLVESEVIPKHDLPGVDLFNACLRRLAPDVRDFSIVNYTHSRPRSVYENGNVFLAKPRAYSRCDWESSLCWIRPTLVCIMEHFTESPKVELEQIFEVYDNEAGLHGILVLGTQLGDVMNMLETPESSLPIPEDLRYETSDNGSHVHRLDSPGWNEDTEMVRNDGTEMVPNDVLLDHEKEYFVNYDEIKTFTSSLVGKISKRQTSPTWKTLDLATQDLLLAIHHIGGSATFRRPQAEVAFESLNDLGIE